jgi:hypothetical protein
MKPTIKELVVYTPAKDFELSKQFYAALNIDGIAAGGGGIHCATQQEPAK